MKNLKEIKRLLIVASIVLLFVITLGVTYAFFTYVKDGTTENTIKSGSITFLYDEINQSGNSISIIDALPVTDEIGKEQVKSFNFRIVAHPSSSTSIPYELTLRKKTGSDNIDDIVKIYLAKTSSYDANISSEEELVTSIFSDLTTVSKNGYSEKTLFSTEVPAGNLSYEQNYRLKMWIDNDADYSGIINSNTGEIEYPYNNKTFIITVNAYANGVVN